MSSTRNRRQQRFLTSLPIADRLEQLHASVARRGSVFEEKTFIVDPISGCENAGQEYASRRQHKCNDQGERRHMWQVSRPADATMDATAGLSARLQVGLRPPWRSGLQASPATGPLLTCSKRSRSRSKSDR